LPANVVTGIMFSVVPAEPTDPRKARPDDKLREGRDPYSAVYR